MNDAYEILPSWALEAGQFDGRLATAAKFQSKLPSNEVSTAKYTRWNFLPKNLFLQMHRFANVYFVFIVIINFVPATQTLDPTLALFPPLFVIGVSLIKDLYENIRLSRADDSVNCTRAERINKDKKAEDVSPSKDLRAGDVIRLYVNDIVPADIVLLYTTDERKICYVDTMDLDGETNLKQKEIVVKKDSNPFELTDFLDFGFFIRAEPPNVDLNTFHGSFESYSHEDQSSVIYQKNILLRGSAIRNTDYIFGMVIYAGRLSKAVMNNGEKRKKVSTFEKVINGDIGYGILFLLLMCSITASLIIHNGEENHWYIAEESKRGDFIQWIFAFLTMLIILQNIIPISLYVSVEFIKLAQVWMIQQDVELYSEASDSSVTCRTLNIAEELGNIQHVFCDKTGTLTENSMVFREMSVEGIKYLHPEQAKMIKTVTSGGKKDPETKSNLKRMLSGNAGGPQKGNLDFSRSRAGSARASFRRPRGNIQRSRPKSHHRRVMSDTGSIRDQIMVDLNRKQEEEDEDVFDANFELESTVKPDFELKERLTEELAIHGKKQGRYDSKALDMFLSLAVCNTVVISVEQQQKDVKPSKNRMSKLSLLTPSNIKQKAREIFKGFGNPSFMNDEEGGRNSKNELPAINESIEPETSSSVGLPNAMTPLSTRKRPNRPTSLLMLPGTTSSSTSMPKPSFETLAATPSMTRESAPTAGLTPVGAIESSSNELRPEDALYEAESPDEAALVNCAKGYGVSLMKRELSRVLVQWPNVGHLTEYRIRATLPFDSTRKMMSVIVQEEIKNDENGGKEDRFILLTKGADSAVFGRLRSDQNFERASADSHVADYATAGLRTLAFGRKLMTEEEVEKAKAAIHKAEKDLDDSDALLQEVYATIETDLELLGVTAIEDRLQEGVPETIRDLRRAGLAVWILTGDKLQTALEIGKLANLIKPKDSLFTVDCETKDELIQKMRSMLSFFTEELPRAEMKSSSINPFGSCRKKSIDAPRKPNTIMIITGKNLKWAFDGEHEKKSDAYENFLKIASACEAVICCRVTPLQKRQVVEKIAKFTKVRTLAIGDGANDVSMIQAANVGIGISGKEGRQAVLVSDFAVPRFRFLSRLLFVHGHWNYARLATMIKYFFFKNTVFVLPSFFFQFLCLASTEKDRLETHLYLYNTIFTSTIPIFVAVFDKILPADALAANPQVYASSSKMQYYSHLSYVGAMIEALWHAIVQFCFLYFCYRESTGGIGTPYFHTSIDLAQFSQLSVLLSVVAGFFSFALDIYAFNWIIWLAFAVSVLMIICIDFTYSILITSHTLIYNSYKPLFVHGVLYLLIPIVILICILPKVIFKLYRNEFKPSPTTKLKMEKRALKNPKSKNNYCVPTKC